MQMNENMYVYKSLCKKCCNSAHLDERKYIEWSAPTCRFPVDNVSASDEAWTFMALIYFWAKLPTIRGRYLMDGWTKYLVPSEIFIELPDIQIILR